MLVFKIFSSSLSGACYRRNALPLWDRARRSNPYGLCGEVQQPMAAVTPLDGDHRMPCQPLKRRRIPHIGNPHAPVVQEICTDEHWDVVRLEDVNPKAPQCSVQMHSATRFNQPPSPK